MNKQRPLVQKFSNAMEKKLKTKDDIYGVAGWEDVECTTAYLMNRIENNMNDLIDLFFTTPENIVSGRMLDKLVNIGNFSAMVYNKIHHGGENG